MRHDEALLRTAIEKLRETEPDAAQVNAASRRVANRLGIDVARLPRTSKPSKAAATFGSC